MNSQEITQQPTEINRYSITRDEFVERFFTPADRQNLIDKKILDEFYINQATGYDALLHIFCGEVRDNLSFGFHLASTAPDEGTYENDLDPNHMAPSAQRVFQKHNFEPYFSNTFIQHVEKTTGGQRTLRNKRRAGLNVMFPSEYDAFSIVSLLINARENRDTSEDELILNKRIAGGVEAVQFCAPIKLVDGVHEMKIKITLEKETGKIISAFPFKKVGEPALLSELSPSDIQDKLLN